MIRTTAPSWLDAERRAAFEKGEERAAKAMAAGAEQLDGLEKPVLKRKLVELRKDRLATCPVCHAPAINPASGECEMASCGSRPRGGRDADPSRTW